MDRDLSEDRDDQTLDETKATEEQHVVTEDDLVSDPLPSERSGTLGGAGKLTVPEKVR